MVTNRMFWSMRFVTLLRVHEGTLSGGLQEAQRKPPRLGFPCLRRAYAFAKKRKKTRQVFPTTSTGCYVFGSGTSCSHRAMKFDGAQPLKSLVDMNSHACI